MEGKGVLFKRFADIDVFDIEVDAPGSEGFIETVARIAPTFGGINLEDIKSPECFEIEERLKKRLKIPVFHDDQHGTAIISGRGAPERARDRRARRSSDVKVVFVGAGAAAIACAKLYLSLRRPAGEPAAGGQGRRDLRGPQRGHEPVQGAVRGEDAGAHARRRARRRRRLRRALGEGRRHAATCSGRWRAIRSSSRWRTRIRRSRPRRRGPRGRTSSWRPGAATIRTRSTTCSASPSSSAARSTSRATEINEPMKLAASQALAALAKKDVPDSVSRGLRRADASASAAST